MEAESPAQVFSHKVQRAELTQAEDLADIPTASVEESAKKPTAFISRGNDFKICSLEVPANR